MIKKKMDDIKNIIENCDSITLDEFLTIENLESWNENRDVCDSFNMRVTKTYGVIITNSDMALSEEKMGELEDKLSRILNADNYGIAINYTPYNKMCKFSPVIYVIERNEEMCGRIIEKIEGLLTGMDYVYKRFVTELRWNENRIFIEINRERE